MRRGSFLLLFCWLTIRARRGHPWLHLMAAGVAFGLMGSTKVAYLVLGLPAVLFLLLELWPLPPWRRVAGLAVCGPGEVVGLIPQLLYNAARFGDPFSTGYGEEAAMWGTPLLDGLSGLLFCPSRGLVWYGSLVFFFVLLSRRAWSRARNPLLLGVGSLLTLLLLYARWYDWTGGWCFGPRFLLPALPLTGLAVAAFYAEPRGRVREVVAALLLLFSLIIAASGEMVNQLDYHRWLKYWFFTHTQALRAQGFQTYDEFLRNNWEHAPIVAYWAFPVKEGMLLPWALQRPGMVLACYGLALVGLVLSILMVRRALQKE